MFKKEASPFDFNTPHEDELNPVHESDGWGKLQPGGGKSKQRKGLSLPESFVVSDKTRENDDLINKNDPQKKFVRPDDTTEDETSHSVDLKNQESYEGNILDDDSPVFETGLKEESPIVEYESVYPKVIDNSIGKETVSAHYDGATLILEGDTPIVRKSNEDVIVEGDDRLPTKTPMHKGYSGENAQAQLGERPRVLKADRRKAGANSTVRKFWSRENQHEDRRRARKNKQNKKWDGWYLTVGSEYGNNKTESIRKNNELEEDFYFPYYLKNSDSLSDELSGYLHYFEVLVNKGEAFGFKEAINSGEKNKAIDCIIKYLDSFLDRKQLESLRKILEEQLVVEMPE